MSALKIDYKALRNSAGWARKNARSLSSYASELQQKGVSRLGNLPGADANGYASSAASCARRKITALNTNADRYNRYAGNIERFADFAQKADKTASNAIARVCEDAIGKRPWHKRIIDAIYDFLFVDILNKTNVGRLIGNFLKKVSTETRNVFSSVVAWFKHGNGKYVLNIVLSFVGAIAAIAGAVVAIIGIPFTGGATIPAVIACFVGWLAAVGATVGAVITVANMFPTVYNNMKALGHPEDPGKARYLGDIKSINDAIKKYDQGSADDNEFWAKVGNGVDSVKVAADVMYMTGNIAKIGFVKHPTTGVVKRYSLSWKNITTNIKTSMGFKYDTKTKQYVFDLKKALNFGGTDKYDKRFINKLANPNTKNPIIRFLMTDVTGAKLTRAQLLNSAKTVSTMFKVGGLSNAVLNTGKSMHTVYDYLKNGFILDSAGNPIDKDNNIFKFIDATGDLATQLKFGSPLKDNIVRPYSFIYKYYLKSLPTPASGGGFR